MSYIFCATLIVTICACNDTLDIQQVYSFDLYTMPVPKRIIQGETIEIRCQILKSGNYAGTTFYIRFFQPDGKGELRLDDGRILSPNDLYPLKNDAFRLYYTSHCTDQQVIDIYVEDTFRQVVHQSFSFSNETVRDEEKEE
jgi:hypothetical protein